MDISNNLKETHVDFFAKLSLNSLVLFATPGCIGVLGIDSHNIVGTCFLDFVAPEIRNPLKQTLLEYGQGSSGVDESTRSPTIRLMLNTMNGPQPVTMWVYRTPAGVANRMHSAGPPFVLVQMMAGQGPDEPPRSDSLAHYGLPRDIYGILDPTRASSFPYEREKLRVLNKKLTEELAAVLPSRKRPVDMRLSPDMRS